MFINALKTNNSDIFLRISELVNYLVQTSLPAISLYDVNY